MPTSPGTRPHTHPGTRPHTRLGTRPHTRPGRRPHTRLGMDLGTRQSAGRHTAPARRQDKQKNTGTGRPPGDDSTGRSRRGNAARARRCPARGRPAQLFPAVGIAPAGLAFLTPVDASVSPGLKLLPSWNTVRLEPCCAFRREATCAPATARPREHMLPGALSCLGSAALLAVSRQFRGDGGDLRRRQQARDARGRGAQVHVAQPLQVHAFVMRGH
jgi:hypothetical protein